jgi:hypothetical protein
MNTGKIVETKYDYFSELLDVEKVVYNR